MLDGMAKVYMLPWSVMPTAGISWRTTASANMSTWATPSRLENSV